MNNSRIEVSWLCSVYSGTDYIEFSQSIESIFNQKTSVNHEIVVVVDGPISSSLANTVEYYSSKYDFFRILPLSRNSGLGLALKEGVSICTGKYIFRFDTDDINLSGRLSAQLEFLEANPHIHIISSYCLEQVICAYPPRLKTLPIHHKRIKLLFPFFNCINHPCCAFRRSIIDRNINYEHMPFYEDYFLWLKCLKAGYKFHNLPVALVRMSLDNGYSRRVGLKIFYSELNFYIASLRNLLLPLHYLPLYLLRLFFRLIRVPFLQYIIRRMIFSYKGVHK